jgi:hypothetical protein
MPTLLANETPYTPDRRFRASIRAYVRLLQSYDLTLHDPDSLVMPLMAGVIARIIDAQHVELVRAGHAHDHIFPVAAEIVRVAEAGESTVSAEALAFLRPAILIGAKQLPDLLLAPSALCVLEARSLVPKRVARNYASWIDAGPVNAGVAVLLACRLAEKRLRRHPHPLLVASNADLRLPLEKYLTRAGVTDPTAAALLGARTLTQELVVTLQSCAFGDFGR